MEEKAREYIRSLPEFISEKDLCVSWSEAMEIVEDKLGVSLQFSRFMEDTSFEKFLFSVILEHGMFLEKLKKGKRIKLFKISELEIPYFNTKTLAKNISQRIGSELISDFLEVLNEDPQKIKIITGIGRKTLPSLLEAIECEGYDVPKIIIF